MGLPCEETEGLVRVFKYEDPCCNWVDDGCDCTNSPCGNGDLGDSTSFERPGELIAEGIQRGSGNTSTVYYLHSFERGVHDGLNERPELITKEVLFSTPVTSLDQPGDEVITSFEFDQSSDDRPIVARTVVHPGR